MSAHRIPDSALKKLGLQVDPDLNTFVGRLEDYRSISKSIKTHSDSLSAFLGNDARYLDLLFGVKQISQLQSFLSIVSGKAVTIPRDQTGGPKASSLDLTGANVKKFNAMYQADYDIFGTAMSAQSCGVPKSAS